jgi:predicted acyl esterase
VFVYGPYNENATAFRRAQRFLEAGYAFLGVNMRGTGCSEGMPSRVELPIMP